MGAEFKVIEGDRLLEGKISVGELVSEAQVGQVMADYEAALDTITDRMAEQDIYFFGVTLSLKKGLIKMQQAGVSLRAVRAIAKGEPSRPGRNPWKAVSPEFWLAAWQFPSLRDRLDAILARIENALTAAQRNGSGRHGLWEADTTAFGEPLVTLLALQDRRFVDAYRRCMNRWNMDHEVSQFEVIDLIVRVHGLDADTEQLLHDRATISTGRNGEEQIADLVPLLDQAYGTFTASPLFRRIIAWLHAEDMKEREEAYALYWESPSTMPPRAPRPRNAPPFHHSDNADLKRAAARMFADLDRQHAMSDLLLSERAITST